MTRWLPTLGALLAMIGVVAGAFGAHALRDAVPADRLATWHTAAHYQLWHALAVIGAALLAQRSERRGFRLAAWAFFAGVVVFSGSLYLLVALDLPALGAVTPFGGVAFIAGWVALATALRPAPRPPP